MIFCYVLNKIWGKLPEIFIWNAKEITSIELRNPCNYIYIKVTPLYFTKITEGALINVKSDVKETTIYIMWNVGQHAYR